MISAIIHSSAERLSGWRYFWAKRVTGFNASTHCARCLIGTYVQGIAVDAPVNQTIELPDIVPGDLVYFCGVASPYRWANNMHMAVRVTGCEDDVASVLMHTGDELSVAGVKRMPFDAAVAERDFAAKPAAYRTCRNFQFGAQMIAEGIL